MSVDEEPQDYDIVASVLEKSTTFDVLVHYNLGLQLILL